MARKRLALVFASGKRVEVGSHEWLWIGVDVHKKTYSVAVWSGRRGLIARWTQPADPMVLIRLLNGIRKRIVRIVYEAGPTGFTLVRALRSARFKADVAAPSETPARRSREVKTDKIDARKLARLAFKDELTYVYIPTPTEEADRQVNRLREQIRHRLTAIQQQIKSFLLQHGIEEPGGLGTWSRAAMHELHGLELCLELRFCLDMHLSEYEHTCMQLKRVEERLEELAQTERHAQDIELLREIRGVGPVTSLTYKLELMNAERFADARGISKSTGLIPYVHQTGEKTHTGRIMRTGNPRLRGVLVESAWKVMSCEPSIARKYGRIAKNTANGNKAIVAVARHLAVVMWRMLVTKERFRSAA